MRLHGHAVVGLDVLCFRKWTSIFPFKCNPRSAFLFNCIPGKDRSVARVPARTFLARDWKDVLTNHPAIQRSDTDEADGGDGDSCNAAQGTEGMAGQHSDGDVLGAPGLDAAGGSTFRGKARFKHKSQKRWPGREVSPPFSFSDQGRDGKRHGRDFPHSASQLPRCLPRGCRGLGRGLAGVDSKTPKQCQALPSVTSCTFLAGWIRHCRGPEAEAQRMLLVSCFAKRCSFRQVVHLGATALHDFGRRVPPDERPEHLARVLCKRLLVAACTTFHFFRGSSPKRWPFALRQLCITARLPPHETVFKTVSSAISASRPSPLHFGRYDSFATCSGDS